VGDEHPKGQVSVWDQKMLGGHIIDNEFWNVNSNAFQKATDQERSRTPCMTISPDFDRRL